MVNQADQGQSHQAQIKM